MESSGRRDFVARPGAESDASKRTLTFAPTRPMVALVTTLTFLTNTVLGLFTDSRHPALAALHAAGEASEALRRRTEDAAR